MSFQKRERRDYVSQECKASSECCHNVLGHAWVCCCSKIKKRIDLDLEISNSSVLLVHQDFWL